jgi:hypothetical protein
MMGLLHKFFKRGKSKELYIIKRTTAKQLKNITDVPSSIASIVLEEYDDSIMIQVVQNVDTDPYLSIQKNKSNNSLMRETFKEITQWLNKFVPTARYHECMEHIYGPQIYIYYSVGAVE